MKTFFVITEIDSFGKQSSVDGAMTIEEVNEKLTFLLTKTNLTHISIGFLRCPESAEEFLSSVVEAQKEAGKPVSK